MANEDYNAIQGQSAEYENQQNQQNQQYSRAAQEDSWQQELAKRLSNKKETANKEAAKLISEGKDIAEKLKKARNVYRAISLGSGVTLYGLVITFLVMNWQALLSGVEGLPFVSGIGKNFGIKFVPALSIPEFIFLLLLWLVVIMGLLIFFVIIYYYDQCFSAAGVPNSLKEQCRELWGAYAGSIL